MERWELSIQESCQPSPSCRPCHHLEVSQSLAGSERSYGHSARPGTRYRVSVSAVRGPSLPSLPSTSVVVETLTGPPHPPTIESVETTGPDSLRLKFSPACPLTGPTVFTLLTECRPTEACRHKQPARHLTDQNTFQVKHEHRIRAKTGVSL